MVLARQGGASFGLFTEHNASPDHLRSDLPKPLVSHLREQWPTGTGGGLAMRSDSLHAPAKQDYQRASEPVAAPIPGQGPYKLTIQYRWPDGTGVADLPFQVGTDLDSVSGTLDHQGAASVDGLNGRYVTVRLGSNASDDTVRHERKAIIAGLDRLLEEERRETEYRAQAYQVLPWYQKAVVSAGAFSEGAFDATDATVDYVYGMYNLNNPAALALDALKSTWSASQGNADSGWGKTFIDAWNEMRHERWVSTIGFSPADIRTEDLTEAYELASFVMFDDELRTALGEFLSEYAVIHHHTEYTYAGGALVFEVVLSAILGPAVLGGGKAAQASGSARYAGVLAALGASFRKFGEALKLQRLRKVWRDADLKNDNHFEAEAKPRPEGVEAQVAGLGKIRVVPLPNDLVADKRGVYGYLPTEDSQFHSNRWPVDWTDQTQVSTARATRLDYHEGLDKKRVLIGEMRESGYDDEEIAKKLVELRNNDRLSHYKTPEALNAVYQRNLTRYGNKLGPTFESQLSKYGSAEEVIRAALRSNDSVDVLTGLAVPK